MVCGHDEAMEEMKKKDPQAYAEYMRADKEFWSRFNNGEFNVNSRTGRMTVIVPVVVHVIHFNGVGNISDAQIQDGIDEMNRDFQKLNPDTGNVRPVYQPLAGSWDIEFRLAKIDPFGNCTNGIVRINDPATGVSSSNDPVRSVSPSWNNMGGAGRTYYNIWITRSITSPTGGNVAGFSFRPGSGRAIHGSTWLDDEMGNIGTAAGGTDLRTPTHETGHAFNLLHPFGSNTGTGCSSTCTSVQPGDGICDTPDQDLPRFPCSNMNNCSNDRNGSGGPLNPNPFTNDPTDPVDMIENYMGYNQNGATCQTMFTHGQINAMIAATQNFSFMGTMVSPSNNVATGTDDAYWFTAPACTPVAEFRADKDLVCGGGNVNFTDESYNATVDGTWTWNWSFPGGTPNTSNLQNPTVTYNTPGLFNVTLTVSNSAGTSTPITKTNYIQVLNSNGALTLGTEDFSNPQFPNNILDPDASWEIEQNPVNILKWERTTQAAYSGNASVWLNQAFAAVGNENSLTTAGYDLSSYSDSIFLRYALAHAASTQGGIDQLRIQISDDCGLTWNNKSIFLSSQIYSVTGTRDNFVPANQSEWNIYDIDISEYAGQSNVKIRFLARSGSNNNFWMDDVTVYQGTFTGLEDNSDLDLLTVYPNPTNGTVNLSFELLRETDLEISLINGIGKEVYLMNENRASGIQDLEFDLRGIEPGIYMLRIKSSGGTQIEKLVIR